MKYFPIVVLLTCIAFKTAHPANIGLLPSSGCYSHDMLMRSVGNSFNGHNISWIQTMIFDFGYNLPPMPTNWKSLIIDQATKQATSVMSDAQSTLWHSTIPFDLHNWWDFRGTFAFLTILHHQQLACMRTVASSNFTDFLRTGGEMDLVVVDHVLQECTVGTVPMTGAKTTVQLANWPICDGYITSFNVPANPSSVAKTMTPNPMQMNFLERVKNTLAHAFMAFMRVVQIQSVNYIHYKLGHSVDLLEVEAKQLFYAAPTSLLFEPVRPISNRIKHFGCTRCQQQQRPTAVNRNLSIERIAISASADQGQLKRNNYNYTTTLNSANTTTTTTKITTTTTIRNSNYFNPDEHSSFVVVTFGSLTAVDKMGEILLTNFMTAFSQVNFTVVWQISGVVPDTIKVPGNVRVVRWLPLTQLLEHPNLLFLVCHGGVTTLMEAVLRSVPILGIPLQGDQLSNLKRAEELGFAQTLSLHSVTVAGLRKAIYDMNKQLHRIQARSLRVGEIFQEHQRFTGDAQHFWLHWSLRHGEKLASRTFFTLRYRGSTEYFFSRELAVIVPVLLLLVWVMGSGHESREDNSKPFTTKLHLRLSTSFLTVTNLLQTLRHGGTRIGFEDNYQKIFPPAVFEDILNNNWDDVAY